MNNYSNILKIPQFMYHSKNLKLTINKKNSTDLGLFENKEIKSDRKDIIKLQFEYPENIIIEQDFSCKEKIMRYLEDIYNGNEKNPKKNNEKKIEEKDTESFPSLEINNENNQNENEVNLSLNEIEQNDIKENYCNYSNDKYNDEDSEILNEKINNFEKKINFCDITEKDKYANLVLNCLDYYPKNLEDFCMIFCPKCKERY